MVFLEISINRNKTAPWFLSKMFIKFGAGAGAQGNSIFNTKIPTEAGKRNACQGQGTAAMEMHLLVLPSSENLQWGVQLLVRQGPPTGLGNLLQCSGQGHVLPEVLETGNFHPVWDSSNK